MFRFAFNTAFLPKDDVLTLYLQDLDPDSVAENKLFPSNFICEVLFQKAHCKCTNTTIFEDKCTSCMMDLEGEKLDWSIIYEIMSVINFHFFQETIFFNNVFRNIQNLQILNHWKIAKFYYLVTLN